MMGANDESSVEQFERSQRYKKTLEDIRRLKNAYKLQEDYTDIKEIKDIACKLSARGKVSINRAESAFDGAELGALVDIELPKGFWWKKGDGASSLMELIGKIESESEVEFGFNKGKRYVRNLKSASIDYVPGWDDVLIGGSFWSEKLGKSKFKEGPFDSPDYESKKGRATRLPKDISEFRSSKGVTDEYFLFTRPKRIVSQDITITIFEESYRKGVKRRKKELSDFIEGSTRMRISSPSQYQMLNTLVMLLDYKLYKRDI